jgi:hypothetical protein
MQDKDNIIILTVCIIAVYFFILNSFAKYREEKDKL